MIAEDSGETKLLLTVPEVAAMTSLGTSHLWRLVAQGRLPVVRIGRSTRVRRRDLEQFIDQLGE